MASMLAEQILDKTVTSQSFFNDAPQMRQSTLKAFLLEESRKACRCRSAHCQSRTSGDALAAQIIPIVSSLKPQ